MRESKDPNPALSTTFLGAVFALVGLQMGTAQVDLGKQLYVENGCYACHGSFDAMDEWISSDNFNGCTFINASAEYPRRDDPVHVACSNHKKLVIQFVEELLADMALEDSHQVAKQIAVLADGAIVNAHTAGDLAGAQIAKTAASRLLETYL